MVNAVNLIFWLNNLMLEGCGDVGNSFTKQLWNCNNVFVKIELCDLN